MISAAVWVARGVSKSVPEFYEPTEEEIQELVKKQEIALEILDKQKDDEDDNDDDEEDDDEEDEEVEAEGNEEGSEDKKMEGVEDQDGTTKLDKEQEELMKELKLETYDDEPEDTPLFGGLKGLSYHTDNSEDPYITMEEERDEDDLDDLVIKDTDSLILVARTEDDVSHLEVHIYEEDTDNLYVHHDVMLPAFPLCIEWLGFSNKEGERGNLAAVGTFQPEIEVWNLDVVDALYPHFILGEESEAEKKKAKAKKPKKSAARHTDAVLGLSWNKAHQNMLASGSADQTVKLWDLNTLGCLRSFEHHTDKVQTLEWNPAEGSVILTGSYDKTVAAFDTRVPTAVSRWKVTADVEVVRWNPNEPQYFMVSTEDGLVTYMDARQNGGKPLFTLSAHDQAACALHFNPRIPNCVLTGSYDKTIKIWDIKDNKPTCISSRDLGIGKIFAASFCPDSPFLVSAAGGKGKVTVWDIAQSATARKHFESRIIQPVAPAAPSNTLGEQLLHAEAPPTESKEDEAMFDTDSTSGKEDKKKKKKKSKSKSKK